VKGAEQPVDVKTAEVELEQDELAAFKAAKRAEEEEGISRVIKDVTARKAASAPTISREGFDWEAFERKGFGEGYSTNDRDNMMKLYSGTVATVSNSEVVKGAVVGINNRDVILILDSSPTVSCRSLNSKTCPTSRSATKWISSSKREKMQWVSSCCHAAKPSS